MDSDALILAARQTGTTLDTTRRAVEIYLAAVAKRNRLAALAKNPRVRSLARMKVGSTLHWNVALQSSLKYRARELMNDYAARWLREGSTVTRIA